jgi:hypothetical protein
LQWPEELARAAVRKWEASTHFHPGVPDRAVRVELSPKDMPQVWRVGEHIQQQEILAAVHALEAAGTAVVRRTGRGAFAVPSAVVLSPAALEAAYDVWRGPSLRTHVAEIIEALRETEPREKWVAEFFARLEAGLSQGRTNLLGRGSRDPRTTRDWIDALRALPRIAQRIPYDERTLAGELFGKTKRLRDLRAKLRHMLTLGDPHWSNAAIPPDDRHLFAHYSEIHKPPHTAIALGLSVAELANFSRFRPYAVILPEMLRQLAAAFNEQEFWPQITTIENETAFIRYLEEDGVWHRIAEQQEIVLYTEGFAAEAVLAFLRASAPARPAVRHWGDSDVHGIRIAVEICRATGGGALFRTDARRVLSAPAARGQELSAEHRSLLTTLLQEDLSSCKGAADLARATLERGLWFEQETHYAD